MTNEYATGHVGIVLQIFRKAEPLDGVAHIEAVLHSRQ